MTDHPTIQPYAGPDRTSRSRSPDSPVIFAGIRNGGLEIIWRDHGWQELAGELMPGTIGAELQEWERQEVEA